MFFFATLRTKYELCPPSFSAALTGRFFCAQTARQTIQNRTVFPTGGHHIDARCLNGAVPQQVGQFCNVLGHVVKQPGKQMPQRMGMDFFRVYSGPGTQALHTLPDSAAIQRLAPLSQENRPLGDALAFGKVQQLGAQLVSEQDLPGLPFQANRRCALAGGLHGKKLHFTDPHAGLGHGFQKKRGLNIPFFPRPKHQSAKFLPGQLFFPEYLALAFQSFQLQTGFLHKLYEPIDRGDHTVDARNGFLRGKSLLPPQKRIPGQFRCSQKAQQMLQAPTVLLNGTQTALPANQVITKCLDFPLA